MPTAKELPDIAVVLATVLQRVPVAHHPLLIALAERLAATRYRGWAKQVDSPDTKAGLLACAAREEQIAERVESLHPDAKEVQGALLKSDLLEINRTLFADLSLEQQLVLQARGERLGAATWRALARQAADPAVQTALRECATLEEESAAFLESLAPGAG